MGLYDHIYPTDAEKKLIDAAARGEWCDLTDGGKFESDAANGASWGPERSVRAEVIVALATLARADWPMADKGIRLLGARIEGALDFEEATLERSLWLFYCYIDEIVTLLRARARTLSMQDCFIKSQAETAIVADGLHCDGALSLRQSRFTSEVRLLGATIGGNLDCDGASFAATEGGDGIAFNADGIKVKDSAFFEKVTAKGGIRLLAATIGDILTCEGAAFEMAKSGNGAAVGADRITVEGSVFLRGITAKGEIRLLGAMIGGNLGCQDASFTAAQDGKGYAFSADGIKIEGSVSFEKINAKGEIRLPGATIIGSLDCTGVRFAVAERGSGRAFMARSMTVKDALIWQNSVQIAGGVDLMYARVGQLADDAKSWADVSALYIDGFEYGALAGRAPTNWRVRCEWFAKMPKEYFLPQPYEHLAKVLRQMGHEHDARKIAIAKQDAYRERVKPSRLHEYWLRIFKATVSYGYEPWNALYWMGAWIIVGMIAFFLTFEMGAMHPSKERVFMSECYATADLESARLLGKCEGWEKVERSGINKPLYLPADYPKFQSFIYAVDVFLPFVDLHQESYWLPSDRRWGILALIYFWAHIAVGWFLATMFIVGFTNIVKKD